MIRLKSSWERKKYLKGRLFFDGKKSQEIKIKNKIGWMHSSIYLGSFSNVEAIITNKLVSLSAYILQIKVAYLLYILLIQ